MASKIYSLLLIISSVMSSAVHSKELSKHIHFNYLSNQPIVLIKFNNGSSIHWNNLTSEIVADKLFVRLKHNYKNYRRYFIDQISNTNTTQATACGKKSELVVGDIAFLIIDKIDHLPAFKIMQTQFDVIDSNCHYPVGYFNTIDKNRNLIQKRTMHYLIHPNHFK